MKRITVYYRFVTLEWRRTRQRAMRKLAQKRNWKRLRGRTAELETIGKRIDELLKTAAFQDKERATLEKDIEKDISFFTRIVAPGR